MDNYEYYCHYCYEALLENEEVFYDDEGNKCCVDCSQDGADNYYSCVYCGEDILYDDLTYDDDGNECHQYCLDEQ